MKKETNQSQTAAAEWKTPQPRDTAIMAKIRAAMANDDIIGAADNTHLISVITAINGMTKRDNIIISCFAGFVYHSTKSQSISDGLRKAYKEIYNIDNLGAPVMDKDGNPKTRSVKGRNNMPLFAMPFPVITRCATMGLYYIPQCENVVIPDEFIIQGIPQTPFGLKNDLISQVAPSSKQAETARANIRQIAQEEYQAAMKTKVFPADDTIYAQTNGGNDITPAIVIANQRSKLKDGVDIHTVIANARKQGIKLFAADGAAIA